MQQKNGGKHIQKYGQSAKRNGHLWDGGNQARQKYFHHKKRKMNGHLTFTSLSMYEAITTGYKNAYGYIWEQPRMGKIGVLESSGHDFEAWLPIHQPQGPEKLNGLT